VPTILKVIGAERFPYLDMEMRFDGNQDLYFGVYTKLNIQSKYLNVGNPHTTTCKKAIPRGVCICTVELTTMTAQNQNKSISVIYPSVHEALQVVGNLSGDSKLPKLGTILSNRKTEQMEAEVKKDERSKDKHNTNLLTRWSGHWQKPIHKTTKKLKKKRELGWLCVRMVYKCPNNLKEFLLGDIQQKCMMGIKTTEYVKTT